MGECGNVSWLPILGDKSHWEGSMCPKQDTASAVRSTQPETRVCPQGLWHDWLTKGAVCDFPADHNFLTITACVSTKAGGRLDKMNWEKGKLEATGIQPRLQTTQLSYVFFLCIWTEVLFEVIFNICVFTQRPVLYIAHLFMLPCCARSPLSRRSTFLTHFVIVVSQLLLVKGIVVASWCSTEFAVHYISNNSESKFHGFWSFQLHTVSSFMLLFSSHYKIKLTWRGGDFLEENLRVQGMGRKHPRSS